jgi:biotin synthase
MTQDIIRTDWTREEIADLFDLPFDELMWEAQSVHRRHHARGEVQLCTLLSIKTGGCPEDCGYCNQSTHADTGLKATKLMDVRAVLQAAAQAKDWDRRASAWARRGATPRTATCPRSSRWSRACARWAWKPA